MFRDLEVIHFKVKLPMELVYLNAVAAMVIDGDPCIVIAGVYLQHALTLGEVRSLLYRENVYCVCVNATGTKLFFGTKSGWIC